MADITSGTPVYLGEAADAYTQGEKDGARREQERIRKRLAALAEELAREHEPSSEVCKHAEGIRLAIGTLEAGNG